MIWQMIEDWFRGILTDGILSNLSGLFDSVNTEEMCIRDSSDIIKIFMPADMIPMNMSSNCHNRQFC